jgi:hypothetical protein
MATKGLIEIHRIWMGAQYALFERDEEQKGWESQDMRVGMTSTATVIIGALVHICIYNGRLDGVSVGVWIGRSTLLQNFLSESFTFHETGLSFREGNKAASVL